MKRVFAVLALTAAAVLTTGEANAQPFVMRISSPVINDVSNEWMSVFKAAVEKRAGNAIRVELYPANQLGQLPATVEGVAMGTIEMTIPAVGFLVGLEPRFQVLDAPGLFDSVEHGQRVLGDSDTRARLATFGASKGVEPLFVYVASPLLMLTREPVTSPAGFKGLKIRATGGTPLYTAPLQKLGAHPITMPLGEVLPALQNHMIDGTLSSYATYTAFKYYDVSKNLTELPGSFLVATGLVNRNFLKSLGPALENIVREESRKAEILFSTRSLQELARMRQVWKANGGQVHSFSPSDQQDYVDGVTSIVRPILYAQPQIGDDYDAFLAAAKRQR